MTGSINELPSTPGAYLLMLGLKMSTYLPSRFNGSLLPAGNYVYAGSARGRGGIRARCGHHLKRQGSRHWHIDWLTEVTSDSRVLAFPGRAECDLIDELLSLHGVRFPVLGFGSTDCRRCKAHLLEIDQPLDFEDIAEHFGESA